MDKEACNFVTIEIQTWLLISTELLQNNVQ